eukprot:371835-Prymnesium_polylepis.1
MHGPGRAVVCAICWARWRFKGGGEAHGSCLVCCGWIGENGSVHGRSVRRAARVRDFQGARAVRCVPWPSQPGQKSADGEARCGAVEAKGKALPKLSGFRLSRLSKC